ncbi:MAG: MlaE family lipid ABC transporter permease subunit [Alphaproteobacteria bacterium]
MSHADAAATPPAHADLGVATVDGTFVVTPSGQWRGEAIGAAHARLSALELPGAGTARIDLSALDIVDRAGAWLIHGLAHRLAARGVAVTIDHAEPDVAAMLDRVGAIESPRADQMLRPRLPQWLAILERSGRATVRALTSLLGLLSFFGAVTVTFARALARPRRIRITAFLFHVEQTGLNALGIVGLINFLIGLVLAYMGATQLAAFGAEIFAVDLVGIAVLREMGILLTAIIVAGRSGSAFTAQIGAMKAQEEVDAMVTIGVDPLEALVLPRLFALLLTLPALTLFGDLMGLIGGALMGLVVLDIPVTQFLERLREAVSLSTFLVGMSKAPVFAAIIALVGCYEGLRVGGSAESVGRQTTRSVVESIFLVIVFDALFAIMYSYLGV